MTQVATPEYKDAQINQFVDDFEEFDSVLITRANPDVYLPLSDKIALFSIYVSQRGRR